MHGTLTIGEPDENKFHGFHTVTYGLLPTVGLPRVRSVLPFV
ncbi:hypothetical protein EHYA_01444 [Embleya hyalina]|uniref:Uncharacterized protein n=1 Tax=Embleya hyalina TaxID=516124 RepID=A0A401YGS5_9ACTN|nr:hypothetical protein EHYA_01444 [Embleya hyalina]